MNSKIIGRGAEAVLIQEEGFLVKDRIKKGYRLPYLDEKLRKQRTKKEAKLLKKSSSIIKVPEVISSDEKEKIKMQFIEGKKLSDWLDKLSNSEQICEEIGKQVALLHNADIIHGDLTTSNMIYVEDFNNYEDIKPLPDNKKILNIANSSKSNITAEQASKRSLCSRDSKRTAEYNKSNFQVYFIDFGLGFTSKRIEDKAVDLHLLKQALEAKHFLYFQKFFSSILKGYNSKDKTKILEQLKKVESRGRYKKGF
ncbi:hypothetical protein A3K73_08850 [Candidatus Pacearchaeota archaeon RBG_13_36_9]|nr:MAG: hypothetical protein A3K73_08850 [Candidatus Pacearchaeota archaeon RBG_13_36_9]